MQQLQKLLVDADAHTSIIYPIKETTMISSDFQKMPVHGTKLMLTDLIKLINSNNEELAEADSMICEPSTSSKK